MPTTQQMNDIDQTNFELFWWNPDIVGYTWWMTSNIETTIKESKEEILGTVEYDPEEKELKIDWNRK